jgi:Tfp pilus assembly protein PilO
VAWPVCCRNGSVRELRASEADASVQVGRVKRGELKIAVKPEQQALDSLRQQLPGQPQASELIERLYHLASAERISLARGEYALGIDPKTQLARYQIVLPVRGSYPQIRGFLKACSSSCRRWCWKTWSCNANASATASSPPACA